MGYSRSLATRASLLARRYQPSVGYISHDDDRKPNPPDANLSHEKTNSCLPQRFPGSIPSLGFGSFYKDRRCLPFCSPPSMGFTSCRNMSTAIGEGSEKMEYVSDVAGVLSDTTVDAIASQAPAVSEVAIAAADSYLPVAALQHLIDYVHSFTGLGWWASIAVTTLLIRSATAPLLINQLKATTKLTLMRPRLEEIKQEIENGGMDPKATAEGQKRMQALFKEYGVHPLTPLKGLFIQGPIFVSFYLAITNMVEKVPSFKDGGAFWFTDLTTPDSLYLFPVLTGLSFWITVECNSQEGLEGNPVAGTMKNVSRGLAVVIKRAVVKKYLGVPEIPPAPPSSAAPKPAFSWAALLKRYSAATQQPSAPSAVQVQSSKPARSVSSVSVLNERIKNLEKQVKGRKKGKKK